MAGLLRFIVVLLVAVVSALGYVGWRANQSGVSFGDYLRGRRSSEGPVAYTPARKPRIDLKDIELLTALNREFATLTRAVVPSVISINTETRVRVPRLEIDPFDYFRRRGRIVEREFRSAGIGSGVIVSKEGHAITNHHVVKQATDIEVTLHQGRKLKAKIIGVDEELDLAVIQCVGGSAEDFIPLPFGDSDKVNVGEIVFAVGNPFGLSETVTQGIVSARERKFRDNAHGLFQTDTPINPGNSGGPLVNLRGEIIGINVAILGSDEGVHSWQGVGLAIQANDVKESFEAIMKQGRPVRAYFGIQIQEINRSIALQLGLGNLEGGLIAGVIDASPAARAGLRAGDVILNFGGTMVRDARHLITLIRRSRPGDSLVIRFFRNGRIGETTVTMDES